MGRSRTAGLILTVALVTAGVASRPAHASVRFTVSFTDPGSANAAYYQEIRTVLLAAGDEWAQYLDGNAVIDVEIVFESMADALMFSAATASVFVEEDGDLGVYNWGTVQEMLTGTDPNGSTPDATISVNPEYIDLLWFDSNPDPSNPSVNVPADKFDAYTIFLHELGHTIAFNGWLQDDGSPSGQPLPPGVDPVPPKRAGRVYRCGPEGLICTPAISVGGDSSDSGKLVPIANYISVFDQNVTTTGVGAPRFTGPNALTVDPQGFALDPSSYVHFNIPGTTMFTYADWGVRIPLSSRELAVAADCGLPVEGADLTCPDTDGDGADDCTDACPSNASLTAQGECGCSDCPSDGGDGTTDPLDPDGNGDPTDDDEVLGSSPDSPSGSGCGVGAGAGGVAALGLMLTCVALPSRTTRRAKKNGTGSIS